MLLMNDTFRRTHFSSDRFLSWIVPFSVHFSSTASVQVGRGTLWRLCMHLWCTLATQVWLCCERVAAICSWMNHKPTKLPSISQTGSETWPLCEPVDESVLAKEEVREAASASFTKRPQLEGLPVHRASITVTKWGCVATVLMAAGQCCH